jgi:hypothetical protein
MAVLGALSAAPVEFLDAAPTPALHRLVRTRSVARFAPVLLDRTRRTGAGH